MISIFGRSNLAFQSTLPRGSDCFGAIQGRAAADFNPRSLAGATNVALAALVDSAISIHAPSRERLIGIKQQPELTLISIHAPSRERRAGVDFKQCSRCNFNPRSLAGATWMFRGIRQLLSNFNPRSLAGATPGLTLSNAPGVISIHAPSRERPNRLSKK